VVGKKFFLDSLKNIFSLAEIARIKNKLNVTMIIRTRKDKIGKVNIY
jgi:hypothetical protein